jgi:hypothetical protein
MKKIRRMRWEGYVARTGRGDRYIQGFGGGGEPERRRNLEDLRVDGKIILK